MTSHTSTARRAAARSPAPSAAAPDESSGYLPIAGYGIIGNLRTAALVGVSGSVDWCCFPDLDGPSVFAAILDTRRGGRFRVRAAGVERGTQRYLPETNVLETTFAAAGGRLRVTDFMPLAGSLIHPAEHYPAAAIVRVVECVEGTVEAEVEWSPRFDYARARPRIIAHNGAWRAAAGPDRMTLRGLPVAGAVERDADGGPVVRARFPLAAGERVVLDTRFGGETERDAPGSPREEGERALRETVAAWEGWSRTRERPDGDVFAGEWREQLLRAALVLKLLTHRHTGAIVAAPTTSLPEEIGGVRNWDYRYTWLRDASFTAQALFALGHRSEAVDFIRWLVHVSRAKGEAGMALRIMYRLHGETDVLEVELPHLEGYRGSRPVRIGNAAAGQRQLDIYGELLGATYEVLRHGAHIDPSVWRFLSALADRVCDEWCLPD
ncbi:MAG TPA: glycoside hydrolase family 15 protein, partial [Gemmatimonadaceae bacterium]|nr:glycoside hydrolase family 15 protein [Gemmatimonadaceae bacterium]